MTVYCVWAYRYANRKAYNFPVGVFTTYELAETAAIRHRDWRGQKYDHVIYELPMDEEFDAEEAIQARGFVSTEIY